MTDALVAPPPWRARRSQCRTGPGRVPYVPDAGARATADAMPASCGTAPAAVLDHSGAEPAPAESAPAAAARAWLAGEESPLGAAAVAVAARVARPARDAGLLLSADLWLGERGAVFAAGAAAELMTLTTATSVSLAGGSWSEGMAGLRVTRPGFETDRVVRDCHEAVADNEVSWARGAAARGRHAGIGGASDVRDLTEVTR